MHLGEFFFFHDLENLYYVLSWFFWLLCFILFICNRKVWSFFPGHLSSTKQYFLVIFVS